MLNKKLDSNFIINKLLNIWKEDPINNFQLLLKKLDNDYEEFDNDTQKLINKAFTKNVKTNKMSLELILKDEDDELQELPSGKERINDESDSENSDEDSEYEESDIEEQETKISFTKDVLPFVIPLTCILTIKNSNMDFVNMLNDIKENPYLLQTFEEQCLIWWNKKDLINLIKDIVNKYFDKNSNTFNITVQFKMSLQSLIDNPKELLELINDCLKPKQKEKQENGEVFTPMYIINEMLDNLDNYYIKTYKCSIFSISTLKWFDPASGMGNFPVAIYLRLMEGLETNFPNKNIRKKHILEKMLYMSELNKKNVFITKQIFDINNEFKLNLYNGDTLFLDTNTEWECNKFDIILGNPPYNKGGIRSHTGKYLGEKNETIWTKFIEYSLELLKQDGFLVFINPLSWLKKSHSLHYTLLEKHIVWIKLWDNIKSLSVINGKIPISLFILHNKLNETHDTTHISSEIQSKKLITSCVEYLNPKYSVPLAYHSIFNKLINFIETNNVQLEYITKTIKCSGTKIKLPTNYAINDNYLVDTYTIKDGIQVKKGSEKHPDTELRKLIIANKASFIGAFIDEGKLGLTGSDKCYIIGNNLELLQKLFTFKIINIISHFTKYRQDFLDKEAFVFIPDIRKLGLTDISEDEFYELIHLTQDEIKQITIIKK
jgi:hypothetical protein